MERGLHRVSDGINVAVITGGHPYDVPSFRDMFDRMPQIRYYIQDLDNWAFDTGKVWDQYDVHLFYNMHASNLLTVRNNADERIVGALERLGETKQGVVVLHHGLLAFQELRAWSDLCNIQDRTLRGWAPHEAVVTEIADEEHPIARGLGKWQRTDELYLMNDPAEGSDVLLTTDHPNLWCQLLHAELGNGPMEPSGLVRMYPMPLYQDVKQS